MKKNKNKRITIMTCLLIFFLLGCSDGDKFIARDDVTGEFLSLARANTYKKGDTEIRFLLGREVKYDKFLPCGYTIKGEDLRVHRIEGSEVLELSYIETEIEIMQHTENDQACIELVDDYQSKLPRKNKMIICDYSSEYIKTDCTDPDRVGSNWY